MNSVDFQNAEVNLIGVLGDTALQSLVLPGKTFVQDGQSIIAQGMFTKNHPTSAVTFTLRANGTAIMTTAPSANGATVAMHLTTFLFRFNSTSLYAVTLIFQSITVGGASPAAAGIFGGNRELLTSLNFDNAITLAYSVAIPGAGDNVRMQASWANIE